MLLRYRGCFTSNSLEGSDIGRETNKGRINIALRKELTRKVNEESRKARRSRSRFIVPILEERVEKQTPAKKEQEEVPFKMG